MSVLAPPEFPAILTSKDWQKKKGLLAKGAGETGVGTQMDKVQAGFNALDWSACYAKTVCTKDNGVLLPGHVEGKMKDVAAFLGGRIEPLRKEIDKLAKLAGDTAAEWKKSKLIPAASAKHAQAVADAAGMFSMAIKGNGVYFTNVGKDFAEEKARLQRNVDIATKGVRDKIASLKSDAQGVAATPTVAQFKGSASAGFYQRIRGIGADLAALSADARIDTFRNNVWLGFSKAGYLPTTDEEVKPKVKEVMTQLAVLEKLLP